MKNNFNGPIFTFAADADVIFLLHEAQKAIETNDYSFFIESGMNQENIEAFEDLWQEVFYGHIKLVIVPSVLAELGYSDAAKIQYSEQTLLRKDAVINHELAEFVRSFCYCANELPNHNAFTQVVGYLAQRYCLEAGMDYFERWDGEEQIILPCKDAYNLAQATVLGLPFLTNNAKDFFVTKINGRANYDKKLKEIMKINYECGYRYETGNFRMKTPRPVSVTTFKRNALKYYVNENMENDYYRQYEPIRSSEVYNGDNGREQFVRVDELCNNVENFNEIMDQSVPQTVFNLYDDNGEVYATYYLTQRKSYNKPHEFVNTYIKQDDKQK